MSEPMTMAEIVKELVAHAASIKSAVLSKRCMVALACVSVIGGFVPTRWWELIGLVKVNAFCAAYHEYLLLASAVTTVAFLWMLIQDALNKRSQERRFDTTMRSLSGVEVQALCNAYHNHGKYSVPRNAAELQSLKELNLIVVPSEPGNFGGQEFVLRPHVNTYLNDNKDYFAKRGIEPQKPDEPALPFCAVL